MLRSWPEPWSSAWAAVRSPIWAVVGAAIWAAAWASARAAVRAAALWAAVRVTIWATLWAAIRATICAAARVAVWATALRNAFGVREYGAVLMWLFKCFANASGMNWGILVQTVMHLGSFRRPRKMSWRATFGPQVLSLTCVLDLWVLFAQSDCILICKNPPNSSVVKVWLQWWGHQTDSRQTIGSTQASMPAFHSSCCCSWMWSLKPLSGWSYRTNWG